MERSLIRGFEKTRIAFHFILSTPEGKTLKESLINSRF